MNFTRQSRRNRRWVAIGALLGCGLVASLTAPAAASSDAQWVDALRESSGLQRQGRLPAALTVVDAAIEAHGRVPQLLNERARVLALQAELDLAAALLEEALDSHPLVAGLHQNLADINRQRAVIRYLDAMGDDTPPRVVVEIASMLPVVEQLAQDEARLREEVRVSLVDEVRADVRRAVASDVRDEVREEVRGELQQTVRSEVEARVRDELREEVTLEVRDGLRDEVRDEVREEVRGELQQTVRTEVEARVRDELREEITLEVHEDLRADVRREVLAELQGDQTAPPDPVGFITAWADAWSAQNVDVYLDAYQPGYSGDHGLDATGWRAVRRERLTTPSFIEVTLSDIELQQPAPDLALLYLRQGYRSNSFADSVRKLIVLRADGARWRIERELVVQ